MPMPRTDHQVVVVTGAAGFLGSAITVDLVSPKGEFLGGAILPGIAMSARALHEYTDLLPPVEMEEIMVGTIMVEVVDQQTGS